MARFDWLFVCALGIALSACGSDSGGVASEQDGTGAVGGSGGAAGGAGTGGSGGAAGGAASAGGGGSAGAAPVDGPELAQGGDVYFVDPDSGDDANDGLHAEALGSGKGPWRTLDRADEHTFEPEDELYLRAGSVFTGQRFENSSAHGDEAHSFVVGAYYMDDSTPRRGIGGDARPIVRGTEDYANHNGNSVLDDAKPRPPVSALLPSDTWSGLLQFIEQSHVRLENLDLRHSGGRHVYVHGATDIEIVGIDCDGSYRGAVQVVESDGVLIQDVWAKGDDFGWKYYGEGNWASNVAVHRSKNVTLRRVHTWDGYGEGINSWYGNQHVVVENSVSLDNRAVGFYIDSTQDFVYRNNLAMRTGRTKFHRSSSTRGANVAFNNELFQFTEGGGKLTAANVCRNGVLANFISVGGGSGLAVWGQHEASDFANIHVHGFLGIGNTAQIGTMASPMTGSRIWDSVFLAYGGSDVDSPPSGASLEHNYFSEGSPGAGWAHADNVSAGAEAAVDSGWQNIETWVPRSLPDDSYTKDEVALLIQKVLDNARLAPGGAWESAGHSASERTWPSDVTPLAGTLENDFDGKPRPTPVDLGAFAR